MAKHINDGKCSKCAEILVGIDPILIEWFKKFQAVHKDAHAAWGLRGKKDQEDAFAKGNSKAKWGESPHNYGCALDFFRLLQTGADWSISWFQGTVGPEVAKDQRLEWGGTWPKFKDYPHVELRGWKELVKANKLKLCNKP